MPLKVITGNKESINFSQVTTPGFFRRTVDFLGLRRNIVYLLFLTVIMLTGEKLWDRFLPKYLEGIGANTLVIGGLGFLQNMLSAFWALPGGYLSDKLGQRTSLFVFNIMAVIGYTIAILFTNWIAVFIGMIFFSAWSAVSLPASMSLITDTLKYSKTAMGISLHSIVRRIPMSVGPILGGILISSLGLIAGIKIAFTVSIILCLTGMAFQSQITSAAMEKYESLHPLKLWKRIDPRLKNLLISDILIRFCEQIPYVFVVIWCLDVLRISPQKFGLLTAIEMMTAAFIYIPVASFSDRMERKPFVIISFMFFTLFPPILYFSKSFAALCVAFVVRGLKEFDEPTRKAIILDLSPKNAKARAYGLYYFIRDSIVSFAALLGAWLWHYRPASNFFAAAAFGMLGTLLFIFYGKNKANAVMRHRQVH